MFSRSIYLQIPTLSSRLKPDYAKPVADVWASALACDIEANQDLDVLSFVDHGASLTQDPSFPSWVADLNRAPHTWRLFKFWPPLPVYKWAGASPIKFSDDFRSLHVSGVQIDVIEDARVQISDKPFERGPTGGPGDWTWNLDDMVARLSSTGPLRSSRGIEPAESPEELR
jgi:hypothetical protein